MGKMCLRCYLLPCDNCEQTKGCRLSSIRDISTIVNKMSDQDFH